MSTLSLPFTGYVLGSKTVYIYVYVYTYTLSYLVYTYDIRILRVYISMYLICHGLPEIYISSMNDVQLTIICTYLYI